MFIVPKLSAVNSKFKLIVPNNDESEICSNQMLLILFFLLFLSFMTEEKLRLSELLQKMQENKKKK